MADKVKWGVLGAAKIARTKVIPGMQRGRLSEIAAIASRDEAKARETARQLRIARSFGSYEALLADPEIEAVYVPLPNHMHVPWSTRAAEAGKHVLCEKPIGLSAAECRELMQVRDRTGVKVGEAFMVRTHPQWLRVRELVQTGALGQVQAIQCAFSYDNRDPENVRNVAEWGGGGLMDIGCYPIQISRFLLGREPVRVSGVAEFDPTFRVDRLTSAILDFGDVQSVFTCGTQMVAYQRVQVLGTKARVEVEIPFNAPPERPVRIFIDSGADVFGGGVHAEEFDVCDQYTIQGDLFSHAIRANTEVPTPLEDSLNNMLVIEAVFRSALEQRTVAL